ncbi:unnamed protein product [Rangifer tarandus platyrhynchus]|uniref:Uncharacterized protein n=2 Tax=Rangifer tarandus platyrhynchus TaxID=3082113 RepID=A0AC59YP64_RANTA|nr:unnamed protein product [Rangifer tarandus platyrhynchus]
MSPLGQGSRMASSFALSSFPASCPATWSSPLALAPRGFQKAFIQLVEGGGHMGRSSEEKGDAPVSESTFRGEALTLESPPGREAPFSDVAGGASDFRAGRQRGRSSAQMKTGQQRSLAEQHS